MHAPSSRLLLGALLAGSALLIAPAAASAVAPADSVRATDTPHGIIGGKDAKDEAYPWMTYLAIKHKSVTYLCGGTLVSQDIVLTAQQCLVEKANQGKPVTVTADIGEVKHTDADTAGSRRMGRQYILGPGAGKGDWAVIKLDRAHPAESYPVLPTNDSKDRVKKARALGWGRTADNSDLAATLQQVQLPLVKDKVCGANSASEICAGDPDAANVGVCSGDHGGPLVTKVDKRWVQIGVTSLVDCDRANTVAHFTRVSAFTAQIQAAIKQLKGAPAQTTGR